MEFCLEVQPPCLAVSRSVWLGLAVRNGSLQIIECAYRMLGLQTTCTCFLSQVSFVLWHFLGKDACQGMDYGLSVWEAVWEGSCLLWMLLLSLFGFSLSLWNSVFTVPAASHTLLTDRRAQEDESPLQSFKRQGMRVWMKDSLLLSVLYRSGAS